MGTLPPTPHHQPPTALFGEKKIEQDPSINSLVFSYVKGIGKHMAKSPLIVIYHLCFARFQLLGAVRRPAVLISFAKRSPWRLDFSTISRLTVLLETHQQNKRFLKWGFTCRVLFLFFEFSFFSIYFEQTKTGNSETKVGFWWHLYKTPNFIGTSDDWFAGYKHGCQTKKVMPGSVQDVARPGGFLDPLVRLEVQGVNRPKHPKNPWSGDFKCFTIGELETILSVETWLKVWDGLTRIFSWNQIKNDQNLDWKLASVEQITWKRPKFIRCRSPTLCTVSTSLVGIEIRNPDWHFKSTWWSFSGIKNSVPPEFFKFIFCHDVDFSHKCITCRTASSTVYHQPFFWFPRTLSLNSNQCCTRVSAALDWSLKIPSRLSPGALGMIFLGWSLQNLGSGCCWGFCAVDFLFANLCTEVWEEEKRKNLKLHRVWRACLVPGCNFL